MRLLDVGCGWGGMAMHAAATHGVDAVGVTVSRPQWELGRKRVAEAGLADKVDIRIEDYRDLKGSFDAISSIGMFEHVGRARMAGYFSTLAGLLRPRGRLLNHAISTPNGAAFDKRSFVARYVFPDGELQDVSAVCAAAQEAGLEVRDVESLREHYAVTLRHWVANLESHWHEAVALVGEGRARVWRLYMTGSAVSFEEGEISIHQVLAVKPDADGESGMPLTRGHWG
jgi:cyclopropane-fatty-acyl-phospholipid synthase